MTIAEIRQLKESEDKIEFKETTSALPIWMKQPSKK